MTVKFNAEEVFTMAARVEQNGAVFYRRAAERFTEEPLHGLLVRLAQMEDQHEGTFERMRERLFGEKADGSHAEYHDLAAAYLHALVDSKIFALHADPAEDLAGVNTGAELLEAAIDREKEAITFYIGIKEVVPAAWGRDAVDEIIREEMSHVTLLTDHLQRLRGG